MGTKEYHKEYYLKNKDKIDKKQKEYYYKNKDKISKKNKERYKKDADKIKKKQRGYNKIHKKEKAIADKKYQEKNKDKITKWQKEYREENKDKAKEYMKIYRKNVLQNLKDYNKTHKKERNVYLKKKRKTDISFKITHDLRCRVNKATKNKLKDISAIRDLGCPVDTLLHHLKNQFVGKMSLKNYGKWHIYHIVPLSYFDLTDKDQFKIACHYLNLQPLWAKENLEKSDKIPENYRELIEKIEKQIKKDNGNI